MGLTHWRIVQIPSASNPMFGAKRLSLNRDTESVVAVDAQHQVGNLPQISSWNLVAAICGEEEIRLLPPTLETKFPEVRFPFDSLPFVDPKIWWS